MEISISDELNSIINYSREEAMRTGSYGIAPDHLFLGILRHRENSAADALIGTGVDIEELKQFFRTELCDDERVLSAADIAAIEEIEREYYTPEFIYGNNPAYSVVKSKRIEGVGEFRVSIDAKGGVVRKVNLTGDFFVIGDIDTMLLAKLKGVRLEREALEKALCSVDCGAVIMNLTEEQLINLLID